MADSWYSLKPTHPKRAFARSLFPHTLLRRVCLIDTYGGCGRVVVGVSTIKYRVRNRWLLVLAPAVPRTINDLLVKARVLESLLELLIGARASVPRCARGLPCQSQATGQTHTEPAAAAVFGRSSRCPSRPTPLPPRPNRIIHGRERGHPSRQRQRVTEPRIMPPNPFRLQAHRLRRQQACLATLSLRQRSANPLITQRRTLRRQQALDAPRRERRESSSTPRRRCAQRAKQESSKLRAP